MDITRIRGRFRNRRTAVVAALGALLVVATAGIGAAQGDRQSAKRVELSAAQKQMAMDEAGALRWWPTTTRRATTTTQAPTTTEAPTTTDAPTTTEAPTTTTRPPPTTTAVAATPPSIAAPPPTTGQTYYVATNGNDAAAGTANAPWRSLSGSIARIQPGDTVYVRGGRYEAALDEQFNINGKTGNTNAWTTIAAFPGERPVVQLNSFWQGFNVVNSSYVEIRGFEIIGTALTDQRMTSGIEINNSHHVRVAGNVVHDVGGCGICTLQANHVSVEGNEVYGASKWNTYQTSAISFFMSKNIGGGDNTDGYSMYVSSNRVHHNTNIAKPGPGLPVSDGNCVIVDYNDELNYLGATLIQNNLCYENGGRGVNVTHSKNVLAVNNTLANNLRHADIEGGELTAVYASAVVFRNNLTSAARAGGGVLTWEAQVDLDHNVHVGQAPSPAGVTDQVAAAAITPDYRLTADSPAINRGNPEGAPANDIRGVPRDAQPDVGAFEAT